MNKRSDIISFNLLLVSLVMLGLSFVLVGGPGDIDRMASRTERLVEKRMGMLDGFAAQALDADPTQWMNIKGLPEDMVIYRYVDDSLQSWNHQFMLANDDLSPRFLFPRLINPRFNMNSPLSEAGDVPEFLNLGPKWYLVKLYARDDVKVICGLEICSNYSNARSFSSVNRRLGIAEQMSVRPLSYTGGSVVKVEGIPQFKILCETTDIPGTMDGRMVWIAFAFFLVAIVGYMVAKRSLRRTRMAIASMLLALMSIYFWGMSGQVDQRIFSPQLYADGSVFYSLGAIIVFNFGILFTVLSFYLVRDIIARRAVSNKSIAMLGTVGVLSILIILSYTYFSLRSIVVNSNISLELFKFRQLSMPTVYVYLSYMTMLLSVPMLVQMLQPVVSRIFGRHVDALSSGHRVALALIIGVFMVVMTSVFGFDREQGRVKTWANRLAVNRDINLEMQLARSENQISDDKLISAYSMLDNTESSILARIEEMYLRRVAQEYSMSVQVFRNVPPRKPLDAQPIKDHSRFFYTKDASGRSSYQGVFMFYNHDYGVSVVVLTVEPRGDRSMTGYSRLLNMSGPGRVAIPERYSHARYTYGNLMTFSGSFPYPTTLTEYGYDKINGNRKGYFASSGFIHFVNRIGDDDVLILSRRRMGVTSYVISVVFMTLVAFLLMSLLKIGAKRKRIMFEKSYYKRRITNVVMISLVSTLVVMAVVSVLFVYSRNETNLQMLMSDKINSIQSILSGRLRGARTTADLATPETQKLLKTVEDDTGSDITLYTPDGKVFMSTSPEVFDRMFVGRRMNEHAYESIFYDRSRYCIQKERLGRQSYYGLYAPLVGETGEVIAVICSPYISQNYGFEDDAYRHLVTIVTLFIILLMLARFTAVAIVDKLFKPLSEMSRKMENVDLDSLDYIEYGRDDEVQSIVTSYNRMVHDLSESTRQLAQAERDKAWSGMARQVAHEIKNPLTPMKLQIQRLQRLKQNNAPGWEDKFDDATRIILDHIDILTDTANEFSTFAKLYTENPTCVNLDQLLKEEIQMFDNREGVSFDYIGLNDVEVMAPKPQLTRVFVNLINNSVQALEGRKDGRIVVSLRNGVKDGFYDIVVEDNGPGVAEENLSKLFTPNFTTKTGGSGLGLAISSSILMRCNATISYSRSFTLGGACFTVSYPKK